MIITRVVKEKKRKERFIVMTDDGSSYPVTSEILLKYALAPGKNLDADYLTEILLENENKMAMEASLLLLSYSQRSRKELAERLKLKGYSPKASAYALNRLEELKYLNDAALAKNILTLRRLQGKGGELIKYEMLRKGIPRDIISETLADNKLTSEEEAARALVLAKKKFRAARKLTPEKAAARVMGFLARRGFSPDITLKVMALLKKDKPENPF